MDLNRTKRIIYISIMVVIFIVLGYLLFRSLFIKETVVKDSVGRITGRAPGTGLPQFGEGAVLVEEPREIEISGRPEQKLIRLSGFPVVSPALDATQKKIRFYKKDGGDLLQSDFSGESQEKISNLTIIGLLEALWAPKGDRAAVFYLDGEQLKSFLHIGTTSTAALPQDLSGFSWSPDGKSLAYLQKRDDKLNLVVADSSARSSQTIFSTPILDAQIQWVTNDRFAVQTAPSGLAEGFIFSYSRSSGAFTKVLGPLLGLTSLWSPDGSKVLVSSTGTDGKNLRLSVNDSSGKALFNITPPTLPQKCKWLSPQKLYCAVPRTSPANSVLPDEYLRGELNTSDRIIRLDLESKKIEEIFNQEDFDISDLLLTKAEDYLFFINRKDGALWSLKLK